MADNSANEGSIRSYLANHGGSVEDAGGRGLTDEMARELGVDKPATLSAILGQMESDGVITRDMRGFRTYRIALVDGVDQGSNGPSSGVPSGDGDGGDGAAGGRGAVSLRDARARLSSAPAEVAEPVTRDPSPVAGVEVGAGAAPGAALAVEVVQPAGRSMTLREALARKAAAAGLPPAAPPAKQAAPAEATVTEPVGRAAPGPDLRSVASGETPSSQGSPAAAVGVREAPAQPEDKGEDTDVAASSAPADGAGAGPAIVADTARRSRWMFPMPEVTTEPSNTIMTAVGIALAGLVLIAVITVVVVKGSSNHRPAPVNTTQPSPDACSIVTQAQASAAFGDNAGPPTFVLGECVYQDATHQLLVQVFHQDARALYTQTHTSSALDISGIGDATYYVDGSLWVLKGTSIMEITLGPTPTTTPSPIVIAVANSALPRL